MSFRSTEPVRVAAMAIAMVVSVGAFAAPRGFIGDTGGGWSTTSKVSARASSEHIGESRLAVDAINGAGIDASGEVHNDVPGDMWLGLDPAGPDRFGVSPGGHWIELAFDQAYELKEMWIWNYAENASYTWTAMGLRDVRIEYSSVDGPGGWGSTNPSNWTEIFSGEFDVYDPGQPKTPNAIVDFGGVFAKYVLITSSTDPMTLSWICDRVPSSCGNDAAGLSEVRFYATPPPLNISSNGVANASVVVDAGAGVSDSFAATELSSFLGQVTGGSFPVRNSIQAGGPNLLVGPAAAQLADPGFTTAGLGEEGIVIRRAGNHMILAGAGTRGTLYAVYTFLEDQVGVHWWEPNAMTVPVIPTLDATALDLTYVPPFEYRETNQGIHQPGDWSARNKFNGTVHELTPQHGGRKYRYVSINKHFVHTYWTYLPPEDYFAVHPEWFALFGGVRDTRGLDVLNMDMRQEFKANVRSFLLANPQTTLVDISAIDGGVTSQDAASQAVIAAEGSPAGLMLQFVNWIAAELETEFPSVTFGALAYQDTFEAPSITVPRSNVIVRLTNIHSFFSAPMSDPQNSFFQAEMASWRAICQTLYIWDYPNEFCNPQYAHPNLRLLGPNIQFFANQGADGVYEEGVPLTSIDYPELRNWVTGQLLWDPGRDNQELIDTFANGYYGPAGPHILAAIDAMEDVREPNSGYVGPCWPVNDAAYLEFSPVTAAWGHLLLAEAAVINDLTLLPRVQTAMQTTANALQLHGRFGDMTVRASSEHHVRPAIEAINGSGLTPDGLRHISLGDGVQYGNNAWLSSTLAQSQSNPRGGTSPGGHWIELAFDEVRSLGEMWIWNYHEYIPSAPVDWRVMGARQVVIQYSTTGSSDSGEWSVVYVGEIPMSPAVDEAPVSLVVDFNGDEAKYVVITTSPTSTKNWSNGANQESGISEVRFFDHTFTTQFIPVLVPNVMELTFGTDTGRDYLLEFATQMDQSVWTSAGMVIEGTGGSVTVHDPSATPQQKFYRIRLQ